MRPLRCWIMRGGRASRCCAFVLANLAVVGLLALHLAALGQSSATPMSGFMMVTEASVGLIRKRSATELNFASSTTLSASGVSSGSTIGGISISSSASSSSSLSSMPSSSHVHPRSNDQQPDDVNVLHPYFDNTTATNVTAEDTKSAYLHCRVRHLGDKVVSWVRHRDFHILTFGLQTYSSDQRFQLSHQDHSDDWTLHIKYTQGRDAGLYECQVSSDPIISHFVTLNVVVAKAEIQGSSEVFVKSGSTITLTCLITQSPEPPAYVFWYHEDRMINYDSSRGGIHVDKKINVTTVSTLNITNAQKSDSGNYTCKPANANPTSVTVHVLNGEKPEAIQHDAKPSSGSGSTSANLLLCLCFSLLMMGLRSPWRCHVR